jgi:hypothetical protein
MFTEKPNTQATQLDELIDSALKDLSTLTADAEQYATVMEQLEKLYALRNQHKPWFKRVDPNVTASAMAQVAGIAMIVEFERVGILTSKAMSLLQKLK